MVKYTALVIAALLAFGTLPSSANAQSSFLHDTTALKWEARGSNKVVKVVEAATPSGQAISAKIKKRKKNPWDVALWVDMDGAVKKGDQIEMRFWARTAKAPKSKDQAEFIIYVGRTEEPYDNIINEKFSPSAEWKSYTLTGTAKANFNSGKLKAEYQLGKQAQTVEFGGLYVSNLGPQTE